MKRLDIRLAAQYSGIKAHTIRIWEQRYGLLEPEKKAGNRRAYTKEDIIRLMDIALLTKYGYPISKVANLSEEKITGIKNQLVLSAAGTDICINKLLMCYLNADIFLFEETINDYVSKKGFHCALIELIIPFFERSALFSYASQSPASTIVINIARKKIMAAMEQQTQTISKRQTIALYLPSGQHFDIILLYLAYLLHHYSFRVIYLGSDTSPGCISDVLSLFQVDAMVTYVSPREKTNSHELRKFAKELVGENQFLIAGAEANSKHSLHYNEIVGHLLTRNA